MLVAIFFAVITIAGCDSRPTRVPVSGQILIDGQPLTFGRVDFIPDGGRMSFGTINSDGHFSLTCFTPNDGALIGKHQIQIQAVEEINDKTRRIHAPIMYGKTQTSGLSQEIKAATDSIVLNLTWKGSGHDKPYTIVDSSAGDGEPPRLKKRAQSKQMQ